MSGDLSKVAVIVPTYFAPTDEGAWRRQVWEYLEPKWQALGVRLIRGLDEVVWDVRNPEQGSGPVEHHQFSFARAANAGLRIALSRTDAEVFCIFGADHVPDRAAIEHARRGLLTPYGYAGGWIRLYDQIRYRCTGCTRSLLAGVEPADIEAPQRAPMDGVLALDRYALNKARRVDCSPVTSEWFDESYEGWGYEDTEFVRHLTVTLGPPCAPPSGRVLTELWHPGGHRDTSTANPNRQRFEGTTR